eukprot:Rmarinus@m.28387
MRALQKNHSCSPMVTQSFLSSVSPPRVRRRKSPRRLHQLLCPRRRRRVFFRRKQTSTAAAGEEGETGDAGVASGKVPPKEEPSEDPGKSEGAEDPAKDSGQWERSEGVCAVHPGTPRFLQIADPPQTSVTGSFFARKKGSNAPAAAGLHWVAERACGGGDVAGANHAAHLLRINTIYAANDEVPGLVREAKSTSLLDCRPRLLCTFSVSRFRVLVPNSWFEMLGLSAARAFSEKKTEPKNPAEVVQVALRLRVHNGVKFLRCERNLDVATFPATMEDSWDPDEEGVVAVLALQGGDPESEAEADAVSDDGHSPESTGGKNGEGPRRKKALSIHAGSPVPSLLRLEQELQVSVPMDGRVAVLVDLEATFSVNGLQPTATIASGLWFPVDQDRQATAKPHFGKSAVQMRCGPAWTPAERLLLSVEPHPASKQLRIVRASADLKIARSSEVPPSPSVDHHYFLPPQFHSLSATFDVQASSVPDSEAGDSELGSKGVSAASAMSDAVASGEGSRSDPGSSQHPESPGSRGQGVSDDDEDETVSIEGSPSAPASAKAGSDHTPAVKPVPVRTASRSRLKPVAAPSHEPDNDLAMSDEEVSSAYEEGEPGRAAQPVRPGRQGTPTAETSESSYGVSGKATPDMLDDASEAVSAASGTDSAPTVSAAAKKPRRPVRSASAAPQDGRAHPRYHGSSRALPAPEDGSSDLSDSIAVESETGVSSLGRGHMRPIPDEDEALAMWQNTEMSRAHKARMFAAGVPDIGPRVAIPEKGLPPWSLRKAPTLDIALEETDPLQANEVSIQFLGFQRFCGVNAPVNLSSVYFTFKFYTFDSIVTDRYVLRCPDGTVPAPLPAVPHPLADDDPEAPHTAARDQPLMLVAPPPIDGGDGECSEAADLEKSLVLKFLVDPGTAGTRTDETFRFASYLRKHAVHIDVWDGDSLLRVGYCRLDLRPLLRQQQASANMTKELRVFDASGALSIVEPTRPGSGVTKSTSRRGLHLATPPCRGKLLLRVVNTGKRSVGQMHTSDRAKGLLKPPFVAGSRVAGGEVNPLGQTITGSRTRVDRKGSSMACGGGIVVRKGEVVVGSAGNVKRVRARRLAEGDPTLRGGTSAHVASEDAPAATAGPDEDLHDVAANNVITSPRKRPSRPSRPPSDPSKKENEPDEERVRERMRLLMQKRKQNGAAGVPPSTSALKDTNARHPEPGPDSEAFGGVGGRIDPAAVVRSKLLAVQLTRERRRDQVLEEAVRQTLTDTWTVDVHFGELSFFEYRFTNPLSTDMTYSIEYSDGDLSVITNTAEWIYMRSVFGGTARFFEEDLIAGEPGKELLVHVAAKETVYIPFKFQSFVNVAEGKASEQAMPRVPQGPCVSSGPPPEVAPRTIRVSFRAQGGGSNGRCAGSVVRELEVAIRPQPIVAHTTLRFFERENEFLKKKIRIGRAGLNRNRTPADAAGVSSSVAGAFRGDVSASWGDGGLIKPAWEGDDPVKAAGGAPAESQPTPKFVRCSNSNVIISYGGAARRRGSLDDPGAGLDSGFDALRGPGEEAFIKFRCARSPTVAMFFLIIYHDPYLSTIAETCLVFVHSLRRFDVSGLVGQTTTTPLLQHGLPTHTRPPSGPAHVHCNSSHPMELAVSPASGMRLDPTSILEMSLQYRPLVQGKRDMQLNLVDSERRILVGSWLVSATAKLPMVQKEFSVDLKAKKALTKKLSYVNPYPQPRRFYLRTNQPNLLKFKEENMEIPPGGQRYIGLRFLPSYREGSLDMYVFINDENDQNEECLCIKANYI